MNQGPHALLVVGIITLVAGLAARDANAQGPYFYGDAGVNLLEDTDLTLSPDGLSTTTEELEFDPGLRLNFGMGYRFNDYLSVGGETGLLYNSVDTIGGRETSDYDLDYFQFPFLGVVNFEFHNNSPFTPYINGGLGFVIGVLDISDHGYYDSASAIAFAFQLGAGVDYAINDTMSLGLSYKFLGTTDQDFEDDYYDDDDCYYCNNYDFEDSLELDGTINHMVAVTFKVRF